MSDYTEEDRCPECDGPLVEHPDDEENIFEGRVTCPNPDCTWEDDSEE